MAKEEIAQLNLMEEVKDDLPIHPSTKKQPFFNIEVDGDEDKCFDLRNTEEGLDFDLDKPKLDKATHTKTMVSI
jgi:hypothetical protein